MNRIAHRTEPQVYFLFQLDLEHYSYEDIENIFNVNGYYYNDLSVRFKKQMYTCRKIVGDNQYHGRVYSDGWVSFHYELASFHGSDHLRGVNYRPLRDHEILDIASMFEHIVCFR